MPVGTYVIDSFLISKLKQIGVNVSDKSIEDYARIVRYTVGTNPRSLKRYLNSYSLINNVRLLQVSEERLTDDLMLFALLGIQISYPQIFRLLTQDSDYIAWDKGFSARHNINWDEIQEKLTLFENNELIDEPWEQVVWGVCQREAYLKSRTFDVLLLLNYLRAHFGDSLHDEVEKAMEFAAITSVDDDADTKQVTQKRGAKTYLDSLDGKIQQLKEQGLNPDGIENLRILLEPLDKLQHERDSLKLTMAASSGGFYDKEAERSMLLYYGNPKKRTSGIPIQFCPSKEIVDAVRNELLELVGDENSDTLKMSYDYRGKEIYTLEISQTIVNIVGLDTYKEILNRLSDAIITDCRSR